MFLSYRISNSPHGPSAKFLVQNSELLLSYSPEAEQDHIYHMLQKLIYILTDLHSSHASWTQDDRKLPQRIQTAAVIWPRE